MATTAAIATFGAVVGAIAAVAAIVGAMVAGIRWYWRPQLICGIPPTTAERDKSGGVLSNEGLGSPSVAYSFIHRRQYLAERFKHPRSDSLSGSDRDRLTRSRSCRIISRAADGTASLPILLINNGRNAARSYIVTAAFYQPNGQPIRLRGVLTETLTSYAYVANPERFQVADGGSVVLPKIVSAYHHYLYEFERWGDAVWAWGDLEAHTYEMLLADIELEPGTEEFFVVYSLDYQGRHLSALTYIQACRVTAKGEP